MILNTGAVYEGKFKDDQFSGLGKITYIDGTVLTAVFTSSEVPKIAKIFFPDYQETYIGQHDNFIKHGYGKLFLRNGSIYEGQFKNNEKSGYGQLTYPDGKLYQGEFQEDEASGKGKLLYNKNPIVYYEGEFLRGERMGFGHQVDDHKVIAGIWEYDQLNGFGQIVAKVDYTKIKVVDQMKVNRVLERVKMIIKGLE